MNSLASSVDRLLSDNGGPREEEMDVPAQSSDSPRLSSILVQPMQEVGTMLDSRGFFRIVWFHGEVSGSNIGLIDEIEFQDDDESSDSSCDARMCSNSAVAKRKSDIQNQQQCSPASKKVCRGPELESWLQQFQSW